MAGEYSQLTMLSNVLASRLLVFAHFLKKINSMLFMIWAHCPPPSKLPPRSGNTLRYVDQKDRHLHLVRKSTMFYRSPRVIVIVNLTGSPGQDE